jgi:hypothetical protein
MLSNGETEMTFLEAKDEVAKRFPNKYFSIQYELIHHTDGAEHQLCHIYIGGITAVGGCNWTEAMALIDGLDTKKEDMPGEELKP